MTLRFGPKDPSTPGKYRLLEDLLAQRGMALKASYSKGEVAQLFACSERTIQEWVRERKLKVHKLPGGPRFLAADIEEFVVDSAK